MEGKTVAVSGATGGIGQELCRYLAALGAELILLDRNAEKSFRLRRKLESEFSGLKIHNITLDLEDMGSVRNACQKLKQLPVDILIHNAGAYSIPRRKTAAGYDNVFQINFVSPYYITKELIPGLRERAGRVIVVGSIAHSYSKTDAADIDFSSRSRPSLVYGNSKRYLMFSMYELFCCEKNISLSVCHPGITFTNITSHYPKLVFAVIKHPMKVIFMPPRKAALNILQGCFDECGHHEWIGPRVLGIWGLPKKCSLRTCSEEEAAAIFQRSEQIYLSLKQQETSDSL